MLSTIVTVIHQILRPYSSYNWKFIPFNHLLPIFLTSQALLTTILFCFCEFDFFSFFRFHIWITANSICLSLAYFTSKIPSSFIHAVTDARISSHSIGCIFHGWIILRCVCVCVRERERGGIFFIHLSVNGQCLYNLTTVNSNANMGV